MVWQEIYVPIRANKILKRVAASYSESHVVKCKLALTMQSTLSGFASCIVAIGFGLIRMSLLCKIHNKIFTIFVFKHAKK